MDTVVKKYLKVEYGSRGEMEVIGLVETSASEISAELDRIAMGYENDEERGCYEEFMYISENKLGVIDVGIHEELAYCYVDYEVHKQEVDRILEIDKLCQEEKMEWIEGDVVVNDILQELGC